MLSVMVNLILKKKKTHLVGQIIKVVQAVEVIKVKQTMVIKTIMTLINSRGNTTSLSKS